MLSTQKGSVTTPGVGPTRKLIKLAESQHDWAISTLNNAIQVIELISNAVSLPIVKGVMLSVGEILGIVKNTFVNHGDFQALAEQCQMIGLVIWHATSETPEYQFDSTIRCALEDLKSSVDDIRDAVKAKAERNLRSRAFHVRVNQETIVRWKNELNCFLILFNTELDITINLKFDKLLAEFQESRISATSNSQTDDVQKPDVLPFQLRVFVRRDDLVRSITQSLLEHHHIAIIGPGGIGKSSIARALLNNEAIVSKFQDRRFFVWFDNMDTTPMNLVTFLDRVATALGFSTSINAHNLITRVLSTSETLLVLDNAETFLDAAVDSGQIADAIDGLGARPNVAILLTTRTTVLPPNLDWVRLQVPVLEESAAEVG
ncbi:hypothetical protein C0995_006882 [Termitomyces sp. Mi166|nr:hypothetical protein C0995_006882 [Termitomyces sp. Mi166\